MKKVGFTSSVLLLTGLVLYAIFYLSNNNKCSGVRVYECIKSEKKFLIKKNTPQYIKLKKASDLFLQNCEPKIITTSGSLLADYSKCDLKVNFFKDNKNWVKDVNVNGKTLTKKQIKANFGK